jgi:hypothetical protein
VNFCLFGLVLTNASRGFKGWQSTGAHRGAILFGRSDDTAIIFGIKMKQMAKERLGINLMLTLTGSSNLCSRTLSFVHKNHVIMAFSQPSII